jgi:hypothetical protein
MAITINVQAIPTPAVFLDTVPVNALRDEDNQPIYDEDGHFILVD